MRQFAPWLVEHIVAYPNVPHIATSPLVRDRVLLPVMSNSESGDEHNPDNMLT